MSHLFKIYAVWQFSFFLSLVLKELSAVSGLGYELFLFRIQSQYNSNAFSDFHT